jgi:transcriptional regulator with GAF, ATPase, and Fis domain/tetratricopeptide (TPR) repeat protein
MIHTAGAGWLERRYSPIRALAPGVRLVRDRLGPPDTPARVWKWAREDPARGLLLHEIRHLAALEHPAYPDLYAWSGDGRDAVAVLEHAEGFDLCSHLRRSPEDLERCAVALLRALAYLHGQKLTHGDLKPEHVLVPASRELRILDLGLAAPIGAPPRGGTGRYLPPEYLEGAMASVAGDLHMLGKTLRVAVEGARGGEHVALAQLLDACESRDPGARPASAAAALAALGAQLRPIDSGGELPLVGDATPLREAAAALEAREGRTVVLRGGAGDGITRLARELGRAARTRGDALADTSFAVAHDPLAALAALLEIEVRLEPERSAAAAAEAAARAGIGVLFADGHRADPALHPFLARAAAALAACGRGALVVVGATDALATALARAGARVLAIPPLGQADAEALLHAAGARAGMKTAAALVKGCDGRPGVVGRMAMEIAAHPTLSAAEAREAAARLAAASPEEAEAPLDPEVAYEAATLDLGAGQARRAARRLALAMPWLFDRPSETPDAAELCARALVLSGDLAAGSTLITKLAGAARPALRLLGARALERLGRYEAAHAVAEALVASGPVGLRAAACMVAATVTYALGSLDVAARYTVRGREVLADLDETESAYVTAEEVDVLLLAIESDIALARGDAPTALDRARRAEERARRADRSDLLARALARVAATYALSGDPVLARQEHAAALAAAVESADVVALPPYIMNLATAEHALGDLGSAIAHYEEAARLADRLDRTANLAAALTNLGGLLASIGALDEARPVLDRAAGAAMASGASMYAGQVMLLRAEVDGTGDPVAGEARAREAREAFLACGAGRQAVEAALLAAELAELGGAAERANRFLIEHGASLEDFGLAPRGALLSARLASRRGDRRGALEAAERAAKGARHLGDRDLEGRALLFLADAHALIGTGAEAGLVARAREAFGHVAASLPSGLRERYLGAPARTPSPDHTGPAGRHGAVTADGLGPRARRLLALVRRVLLEGQETRLLEAAVDEAVDLTGAERAFLLRRNPSGKPDVAVARNLDRETIRRSRFRFSRSVAERVLASSELLLTASAPEDPALRGARSVVDLGLRSILCVPIRAPSGTVAALYLDHRFEAARFSPADAEIVLALADVIGVALENARLHREASERTAEIARARDALREENARRAAEVEVLSRELAQVAAAPAAGEGGMIGSSPRLRLALDLARRVAASDLPVLIEGESGTGKELLARFVHERSPRARGPFVAINCGALPEPLLESELFGHERGAFTGATRAEPGLFRTAHSGTLLLDEIGEMPIGMQTRLLRVLQEREVRPVGAHRGVRVDVRVLTATNRILEREVEEGRFRQDLYFRLLGARVELPPLRARKEDIAPIAEAVLARAARESGRTMTFSREALRALLAHDWPGNIRELEQAVRRGALLAHGTRIQPEDLALGAAASTRRAALERFDRGLVEQALRGANRNRTAAAAALGISRVTLHRWIRKYGIA